MLQYYKRISVILTIDIFKLKMLRNNARREPVMVSIRNKEPVDDVYNLSCIVDIKTRHAVLDE